MEFWWEDDTHTIMRLDIGLGTTWDEYHVGLDKMARTMTAAPHRVYLIVEIMGNMPPGNPLPHLKQGMATLTEISNLNGLTTVGLGRMSAYGQHVVNMLVRLFGRDMPAGGSYNSVDEARAAILKLREGEKLG